MRPIYLIVTAFLALLVAGMFVLPRLLDSEAIRSQLIAQIEESTGLRADIRGYFDVAIIPQPKLSIGELTIGNPIAGDDPWLLDVGRLDVDLRLAPLLVGRLDVIGIRIVRPIVIVRDPDAALARFRSLEAAYSEMEDTWPLEIVDGSLSLQNLSPDKEISIAGLDAAISPLAETPGHTVAARGQFSDQPLDVRLEVRNRGQGRRNLTGSLKLGLDGKVARVDADAVIETGGGDSDTEGATGFDGFLLAESNDTGRLSALLKELVPQFAGIDPDLIDLPIRIGGQLRTTEDGIFVTEGEVRLAQNRLTGEGSFERGMINAEIGSEDIELTGALGERGPALVQTVIQPVGLWLQNQSGKIDARIDRLRFGAATLDRAIVTTSFSPGRAITIETTGELAGSGTLSLDATLDGMQDSPRLEGRLEADSQNVNVLWGGEGFLLRDEGVPLFRRMALLSDFNWQGGQITFDPFDLRLDASRYQGQVAVVSGARHLMAADLKVDRLDLDRVLASELWPYLHEFQADPDIPIDLAVSIQGERLRLFDEVMQEATLETSLDADSLVIRAARINGFLYGSASITGAMDRHSAAKNIAFDIEVSRGDRLARLLDLQDPAAVIGLGPIIISGSAETTADNWSLAMTMGADDLKIDTELSAASGTDGILAGEIELQGLQADHAGLILSNLSRKFALALPDPRPWFGNWPRTPFTEPADLPRPAQLKLRFTDEAGEAIASFALDQANGRWRLYDIDITHNAFDLKGGLVLQAVPGLSGAIEAEAAVRLSARQTAPPLEMLGLKPLEAGPLELAFNAKGNGRSADGWIRSLEGQGSLSFADGGQAEIIGDRGFLEIRVPENPQTLQIDLAAWMISGAIPIDSTRELRLFGPLADPEISIAAIPNPWDFEAAPEFP